MSIGIVLLGESSTSGLISCYAVTGDVLPGDVLSDDVLLQ